MTSIFEAAETGDVPRLEAILDGGGNVNQRDTAGWTALHLAACYGHVTSMTLLLDRGADLSVDNMYGWTALHEAAENGHVTAMALLLDRGADLSVTDKDGETALHFATRYSRRGAAVTLLLDHGADLSVTDKLGNTIRMLCRHEEVTQALDSFVSNVSEEWRPSRHHLYPRPFRRAVATLVSLWSWNFTTSAPWHPDSPFTVLSLELLYEVFMWLAVDIASCGYVVVTPVTGQLAVQNEKRGEEEDGGP